MHSPCAVDCGMVVDCFVRRVLISGLLAGIVASSVASAGLGRWTTSGPEGATVLSLAVDPADSGRSVRRHVRGRSLRSCGFRRPMALAGLGGLSVSVIVTDPSDGMKLYAAAGGTVFKSADGGESWRNASARPAAAEQQRADGVISRLCARDRSAGSLHPLCGRYERPTPKEP